MSDMEFYYEENDKLYRIRVERDDEPFNPREEANDGRIGTMVCEHPHYNFGDVWHAKVEEYVDNLLRENVKEISIINYIKKGKASNNLELKYNRHERTWELWGDYYTIVSTKVQHGILNDTDQAVDWLIDDMIEALPIGDKINLLERKGFYFLPLAIYDHSGVTMWAGSKWSHFDAQWDCSDVGFIYTTKAKMEEVGVGGYRKPNGKFVKYSKRTWKECADADLRAEVEEYDNYLRGDVYGFHLDRYDALEEDWDEDVESCWGFNSSKWGEELVREMDITSEPLMDEDDAEMVMTVLHDIAMEEEHERKVMDQADYTVCV